MFDIFIGPTDWVCEDPAYTEPPEEESEEEDEKSL